MTEAQMPQTASVSSPRKLSVLSLFLGMIIRPRSTLAYLRESGGLSWLWPAGLALVVLILASVALAPIAREAAIQSLEAMREQMGEAQYQQAVTFAANPVFVTVFPAITTAITLMIGWLLRGGVLYLFSLLLGGQSKFGALFRMAVWTTLPDIVRQIVTTIGTLVAGRTLQAGLGFLVEAPEGVTIPPMGAALWRAFLSGIDIYWLWGMILTVIGVAVTAQFSWRKGLLVTLGYWLLVTALTLGYLALSLSMASQFVPQ